jgi:hypothetical protein
MEDIMHHDYNFADILQSSTRAAWRVEDVLSPDASFDLTRCFMPESLARTAGLTDFSDGERLLLNQIRGHEYLAIFGLVEEFVLPFVLDHARPQLCGDDARVRALLNFAGEEAKHIDLFKRFHARFVENFGVPCEVIGPSEVICTEVLRHDPLAVALAILQIEWMTQRHYLESVGGDFRIDPLFANLLRHHWIEEAQHAKLDTLMVEALADRRGPSAIQSAVEEYLEIGSFIDTGLKAQSDLNLDAWERASGRILGAAERAAVAAQQHQALRWTYLGSGMTHPKFLATLAAISPAARDRVAQIAPAFC